MAWWELIIIFVSVAVPVVALAVLFWMWCNQRRLDREGEQIKQNWRRSMNDLLEKTDREADRTLIEALRDSIL